MSLRIGTQGLCKAVRAAVVAAVIASMVHGINGLADDALDRKVKARISPVYPDIARRMGLSGSVKLEIVVAPSGMVKETKVIGGHPILVNAVVDAVKKWRFEAGAGESTGVIEFKFDPGN